MSFFRTNFYPLTLLNIASSSTSEVSQETISEWCHTIVADGKSCNNYYQARSQNETYTHHDDIYKNYAHTLQDIFAKASHCNASAQLILIQTLCQTLSKQDGDDHFGETFMKNYDSFLQDIVTQLLETTNAPLADSEQMKHIAFELLTAVLGACRPFESLSWVTERLYDLDWSDHHDSIGTKNKSGTPFVITIESYGQSVLENLGPSLSNEYVTALLTPCTLALSYIDNILRHAPPQNQQNEEEWHLEILTMTNTILDFVSFCYDKCTKLEQQDTDTLLYVANYLLVLIFDKFVLNVDMNLSNTYHDRFHSRYIVKHPKNRTNESEGLTTKVYSNEMMNCVSRCLELASQNGTTFDELLSLEQRLEDPMISMGTSENIQSTYPLSRDGIISVLAISLYDRYLNEKSTGSYLFSMLIEPVWIGRQCLGMVMNLMKNPQETQRIDKSLMILLYLADNVDDDKLAITLDDLDKEFTVTQGDDQKMSLVKGFQMLTSMTSMADNSKFRFLGHQLIARFIQLGRDDTRLFILTELLSNCPFPTMRTAAIGLLKNQVDRAFQLQSQQQVSSPHSSESPFCTKLLLDKFFPMIYENQVASTSNGDHLKKTEQDAFWEKYSYHMQAMNFYYYLMMRDQENNTTCVWDEESRKWMKSHYLGPLEQQCGLLSQTYQQMQSSKVPLNNPLDASDGDINGELMQLTLMTDMIDQINNKIKDRK
ncbi:hypothetical protein BCR42DRAFT_490235 [Absidia repens]|uniref:YAP-binding/ALF4/Glomulin n=1 Tax=Absidia repens TaxID=90262 RepID=A0A1X2IMF3_9FUNG|nr:hypothetical protein BCR42DRAFT_490235 [Absidia repens]